MELYNKIDSNLLKKQMEESEQERTTFSFYRYFVIDNPQAFRDQLFRQFSLWEIYGRIYVAGEGINGQVSIPSHKYESFRDFLYKTYPVMEGMRLNIAIEDNGKSFYKLKIKVREKIVADGLEDDTFNVLDKGTHLSAEDFNALTDAPDTIIVDMRNHYESEVGHFKAAILPDVDTFRESLPHVVELLKEKKDQPVVMYCTGGIRCEKASAYLKHQGFKNVYQLDGGIIEYSRQVEEKGLENKFIGKNFVFDERLGERISSDVIAHCHQCGKPCDTHVNCKNEACNLLFIQCEECAHKMDNCCSDTCKDFIQLPEDVQKEKRKGWKNPTRYYRKGRFPVNTSPVINQQAH